MPDSAQGKADFESHVARETELGLQRAIGALQARGDARSQAVALTMEIARSRETVNRQLQAVECRPGTDCDAKVKAMTAAVYLQAPQATDRLLELARSGTDAWIAQLALIACDIQFGTPTGCAGLSPHRLATLEPDNAAAWLELATREPAALDEAMYRASQAAHYDSHWGRLAALVDEALPTDATLLQRHAVVTQAIGFDTAYGPLSPQTARQYCSERSVRDANRAQICDAIARVLAFKGRDVIEALAGYELGARLGWPAEQRQLVRDEQRAAGEVLNADDGSSPLSCQGIDAQLRRFRDGARFGELNAARRTIERSGVSMAELLRRADSREKQLVAQASPDAGSAVSSAAR